MTLDKLKNKTWRLNHLYKIIDTNGNSIPFRLNPVQLEVHKSHHPRKLILKARKLGMSTFAVLTLLDDVIFSSHLAGGIVSYSLEHAQHIFKRIIGHALDSLHPGIKAHLGLVQRSAKEVTFSNGSFLRVDTSLRGGTYHSIVVSEFGKTCARSPMKAEEVITGTIQAVPRTGKITIESTGEGNDGYFADMVRSASERGNGKLNELDYELFFYPWYLEPEYQLQAPVSYEIELEEYFETLPVKLTHEQKHWYAHQRDILGDKIKQEFPSTISEAFLSSNDAYYFAKGIEAAYTSNRCLSSPIYDPLAEVYIAMDIGVNDLTVIIFFQVVHGEIRILDHYADSNKGVDFYARFLLQDKPYLYHTLFLPHDSVKRDGITVENSYEREFRKLFSHTQTRIQVLKRTDKGILISNVTSKLGRCVFNVTKTKPLLDMLCKYRKKWSEQYGKYLDEPYHDVSSNYADAMQYVCQAVTHLEATRGIDGAYEKHKQLIENRVRVI